MKFWTNDGFGDECHSYVSDWGLSCMNLFPLTRWRRLACVPSVVGTTPWWTQHQVEQPSVLAAYSVGRTLARCNKKYQILISVLDFQEYEERSWSSYIPLKRSGSNQMCVVSGGLPAWKIISGFPICFEFVENYDIVIQSFLITVHLFFIDVANVHFLDDLILSAMVWT